MHDRVQHAAEPVRNRAVKYADRRRGADRGPLRLAFDTSLLVTGAARVDRNKACYADGDLVNSFNNEYLYECDENDVLTSAERSFIELTLLPSMEAFFSAALKVDNVQGNLVLSSSSRKCSDVSNIDEQFYTDGVPNADMVVFVTARPADVDVLAFAGFCEQDRTGRPVAGMINFAPRHLVGDLVNDEEAILSLVGTALHEMSHALGFSSAAFGDFIDANGFPRARVTDTAVVAGIERSFIVTPAVRAAVREQFDCDSLIGGELEEYGGQGTAGSHWEKRAFNVEVMTGTSAGARFVYSPISLALLEDTGWYSPDYAQANVLLWGRNEGCSFAGGECSEWPEEYFCDHLPSTADGVGCSWDGAATGYCDLNAYTQDLPAEYQHVDTANYGGTDVYDFCPIWTGYSNGDCRVEANAANSVDALGETYADGSFCFVSSLVKDSYVDLTRAEGRCYAVTCRSESELFVTVGTNPAQVVECPPEGGPMTVTGYSGQFECPPAARYCAQATDFTFTIPETDSSGGDAGDVGTGGSVPAESGTGSSSDGDAASDEDKEWYEVLRNQIIAGVVFVVIVGASVIIWQRKKEKRIRNEIVNVHRQHRDVLNSRQQMYASQSVAQVGGGAGPSHAPR